MSFIWPAMLLLLVAIPVGAWVYARLERRRRGRAVASGFPLAAIGEGHRASRGWRRRLPAVLMLAGLAILVVALARPQSVVGVPRIEGTIVLAFDVSGSMAATDLGPTRMEAAKAAARTFVERQPPSVLIGVVAFSDSGFSTQVPTRDQALVLAAINRLKPERGTSIGRGIQESLNVIASAEADPAAGYYTNRSPGPTPQPVPPGTYAPAAIVLLTDGENTAAPDPLQAASSAVDRGVRIHTVGIGSAAGATLEVEGFMIHSQLDEATLRQLSERTGGAYYAADDPTKLSGIYDKLDTRLVVRPEAMEVTSLIAGAAVLILLAGAVTSLAWLGRVP
jgi:Ca-activated chloride channel homolog